MEEMNRSNDQGLGLPAHYIMLFSLCTVFFATKKPALTPVSEVPSRFELENKGFADLRLTTWLWHRMCGAVDGIRTRDIHLGKVALYQLSYYRIKPVPWGGIEPPTL